MLFRVSSLLCAVAILLVAQQIQDKLIAANESFKAQRLNEAKGLAEQVLQTEPANSAALEIVGNVQYLQGQAQAAINTFVSLLEAHPDNHEAPYMLGRIYYAQGSVDQAMGQFERLLRLDGGSYRAYDNLGLCYAAKGNNEKALRYFLTAIKLAEKEKKEYDVAYADLAELLLRTGDAERAFGAASKAADRNPHSARNFYLGAKALEQLGKLDLCLNWLQRAGALDPNYPEPQYLMAKIYRRLGQDAEAEKAQQRFLAAKARSRP